MPDSTEDLSQRLQCFVRDRGWGQFHDPKNLSMAIAGEAGELVALYQWLDRDEAVRQSQVSPLRDRVREEMADVFIYLLFMANAVGVDLLRAAHDKMDTNERRFQPSRQSPTPLPPK